ncbi:hypothetical protein Tco_0420477 [Tanacetum coccineum]
MTAKLGPEAQVIVWSKPGGLVYLLYVIKSPQSSMILPMDHVLRAVINARLPVPLLLLVCFLSYLFHAAMLPYQVGDVPLTCVAAIDYVSGIHVASSDYWLASFFARLFKMTNFAVKHSIMTPEMVENFCNDYYIPDEVHPVAPGRDKTITQFPEGKVALAVSVVLLLAATTVKNEVGGDADSYGYVITCCVINPGIHADGNIVVLAEEWSKENKDKVFKKYSQTQLWKHLDFPSLGRD